MPWIKNVIRKLSKTNPKKTAVDINKNLLEHHNIQIPNSAIKLILRELNLHGQQPRVKSLISAKERKARLEFERAYKDWTLDQRARVLFCDESKSNLFSFVEIQCIRLQRNKETRLHQDCIKYPLLNTVVDMSWCGSLTFWCWQFNACWRDHGQAQILCNSWKTHSSSCQTENGTKLRISAAQRCEIYLGPCFGLFKCNLNMFLHKKE